MTGSINLQRLNRKDTLLLLKEMSIPALRMGGGDPKRRSFIVNAILPALREACGKWGITVPEWLQSKPRPVRKSLPVRKAVSIQHAHPKQDWGRDWEAHHYSVHDQDEETGRTKRKGKIEFAVHKDNPEMGHVYWMEGAHQAHSFEPRDLHKLVTHIAEKHPNLKKLDGTAYSGSSIGKERVWDLDRFRRRAGVRKSVKLVFRG